mmetsp:Transcript_36353/g.95415  ORF Transcript_36353/g.95415 Transcript_36353/m.95415 type:complete len:390 (-) Transcript_36353:141-1310(-)
MSDVGFVWVEDGPIPDSPLIAPRPSDEPRVLRGVDPELHGLDADGIRARIRQLRDGMAPVYPRQWVDTGKSAERVDNFLFMQFNMLAEGLSALPDARHPFELLEGKTNSCGGFAIPEDMKTKVFDFSVRKFLVLEDILLLSPDILTLEECDRFVDFFMPALSRFGYHGVWVPKAESPCKEFGWYSDGVAIVWKKDVFTLVTERRWQWVHGREGQREKNVSCATILQKKSSGKKLVVACTHLKAKANQENEDRRESQIAGVLTNVAEAVEASRVACGDAEHPPIIVAADFNTDPFDVPGVKSKAVPAIQKVGFESAYALPADADSEFWTTWKRRGTSEVKHVIDYIFHSPGVACLSVYAVPPADEIEEHRLPGVRFPSDHISIAAKLALI